MRFQELRDADGTVLANGLHPAIAVVAAGAVLRAAAISAVVSIEGCKVIHPSDVDEELRRAAAEAVHQHELAVADKRAKVAQAEQALAEATAVSATAGRDSAMANTDLARFDEMAGRLASAEEAYEAAVRTDAEAARSLAAALGELDRILGQRHSASTSLEQARKSRDSRGVPEAVLTQAMNLQSALAKAESDKHEAVQQADEISQAARVASRDALLALETAHDALKAGMALISSGDPNWGAGVPLPGLLGNHRDRLAVALDAAQTAEFQATGVERAARGRLEQERRDLDALVSAGPPSPEARDTAAAWLSSEEFNRDDAVFCDDAFGRFGADGVASLLTTLAGRGCQVVYLTDAPEVLGWAIGLPHEAGGVSTISGSRSRRPALVD